MKKQLLAVVLAAALLTGCGAKKSQSVYTEAPAAKPYQVMGSYSASADTAAGSAPMETYAAYDEYKYDGEAEEMAMEAGYDSGNSGQGMVKPELNSDRKIIYTAYLSLEAREYEDTMGKLRSLIEAMGGYIDSSNEDGNPKYGRSCSITVKIPVEKYNAFVNSAAGTGNVTSRSENASDVTEHYVDVKSRLETYKATLESYKALLDRAETIEEILEINRYITEVQAEVESYQAQMNSLNSRVSMSTIDIYVHEVVEYTIAEPTFGERMADAFADGLEEAEDLILIVIEGGIALLPSLILIAAAALILITIWKKARGAFKKNADAPKKPVRRFLGKKKGTEPENKEKTENAEKTES